ncbi:hypothetical protein Hdeb2414_s0006g00200001 [Helianthus debilis subsp. tardiflorus]
MLSFLLCHCLPHTCHLQSIANVCTFTQPHTTNLPAIRTPPISYVLLSSTVTINVTTTVLRRMCRKSPSVVLRCLVIAAVRVSKMHPY